MASQRIDAERYRRIRKQIEDGRIEIIVFADSGIDDHDIDFSIFDVDRLETMVDNYFLPSKGE